MRILESLGEKGGGAVRSCYLNPAASAMHSGMSVNEDAEIRQQCAASARSLPQSTAPGVGLHFRPGGAGVTEAFYANVWRRECCMPTINP